MKTNSISQGILLFWLTPKQRFALGTLKIKEIVPFTQLTQLPEQHPAVLGTAHIRGVTMPVVDMAYAIGSTPVAADEHSSCYIIITDCQRKTIGFMVRSLDRIVDCNWRDIEPPPKSLGRSACVTGVTKVDDQLVQLVDVEHIFAKLFGIESSVSTNQLPYEQADVLQRLNILVVDDSSVARKQLSDALNGIGVSYQITANGQEALDIMRTEADAGHPIDLLVSDIEMPGLDGYELAFAIRDNPSLAKAYIILHTSISSEISVSQAHQVGANEALTKFDVDELIQAMLRGAAHD
ncbi:chemotaxis protein [Gilvimarinus sp. SDUM040013]|uniref:Chemotaxis protein n=1 Tax=Gilvimarinus gilvus TaxID=3058038 RepID=A0ABU4RW84_9GAMM|nr:chemotaxis protein [Gilvimarinus sp. SDUM040013]MDO3386551.1 chemotaxis protein [Gilvimarinus sp. SDUM040013]MDX6849127.1 chemotaxis protein [Gilvimarinus sp. SDUM040013]